MSVAADQITALVSAIIQPLMAQMTSQVQQIVSDIKHSDVKKGRIDHRSIGGPPEWDSSKEETFKEWVIKLQA